MSDKHIIVSLHQQKDYRFEVTFDEHIPVLLSDEPAPLGSGMGPSPVQMSCAAVGNCLSDRASAFRIDRNAQPSHSKPAPALRAGSNAIRPVVLRTCHWHKTPGSQAPSPAAETHRHRPIESA